MKRNLKYILVAAAAALMSGGIAQAAPMMDMAILGYDVTTQATTGTTYSNSVTVHGGDTIAFEVIGEMAPIGTVGAKTITSLTYGTDGIINLPFNLIDATPGNIPITGFSSLVENSESTTSGHSPGTYGSNDLNGAKFSLGAGLAPLGVDPGGSGQPAESVILTGQFTVGSSVTGSSSLGETFPTGASGSGKVDGGTGSFLWNTAANDTADTQYAPLALNTTSTPEPGSLSFIVIASAGLLAARRGRRAM